MFNQTDIYLIDQSYFNIIQLSYTLTIQSKNTGHFWHIEHIQYPQFQRYVIYHRHHDIGQYHRHANTRTLFDAIKLIQDHDAYHLQKKGGLK